MVRARQDPAQPRSPALTRSPRLELVFIGHEAQVAPIEVLQHRRVVHKTRHVAVPRRAPRIRPLHEADKKQTSRSARPAASLPNHAQRRQQHDRRHERRDHRQAVNERGDPQQPLVPPLRRARARAGTVGASAEQRAGSPDAVSEPHQEREERQVQQRSDRDAEHVRQTGEVIREHARPRRPHSQQQQAPAEQRG